MRMGNEEIIRTKSAPIVGALAQVPGVQGILCFGSYVVGTFDRDSDVDLYVLCHPDVPPSHVRMHALQEIEGIQNVQMDHEEFGWDSQWCPRGDRCRLDGLPFDIAYNTLDWMKTVVSAVKEHGATSLPELRFRPYTMLGLLENSVVLYDPKLNLQAIRSNLYPYPTKLRQTLLSENLLIARGSLEELQDYVRRSIGNSAFHFHFSRALDSLSTLLFAINRRYDPATKRTEEAFRDLKIVPDRFMERYGRLLETPLTGDGRREIVNTLEMLLGEVEDLGKLTANRQIGATL
jgi:predicted nucleotidyltransferase